MSGHIRHAVVLATELIPDAVDAVILHVDSTDQHVVGDVVQVPAELEPGPSSADVVRGALALHLEPQRRM